MDNINLFKKIPTILEIRSLSITDEIKEKISPDFLEQALQNEKKIYAYRIVYLSQGHKVVGYILEPKEPPTMPCPCIIYNRGGSNEFGSIKIGQLFLYLCRFALQGYITFFTQYSGNGGSEGKDEFGGRDLEDVLNLYEIIKQYKNADSRRVGMYGASRGGMMTYLSISRVDWIRAAVVLSGLADLPSQLVYRPEMLQKFKDMFDGAESDLIKRSALYFGDKFKKNVPLLMMHGSADWRVSPLDSIMLSAKLYKEKVPHRLVLFEGGDHALTEFKEESVNMSIAWFNRFVRDLEPLPDLEPHGA